MLLKDTWPEKGLIGPIGRELNKVAKILNGAVGLGGVQVFTELDGMKVYGGSVVSGSTEGLWQPGEIDNDEGTINVGRGIFVDGGKYWHVEPLSVLVSSGSFDAPSFIYVEYAYADGTPVIRHQASASFPVSDIDYYRRAIMEVYLENDQINVKERLCTDLIDITALMARY